MTTKADVARIAREVCAEFEAGNRGRYHTGPATHNLWERGWCSKFVRKACYAVTGIEWPGWAGRFATWTERNLTQQGYATDNPQAGDIVCFNALTYQRCGRYAVWGWPAWKVKQQRAVGHIGVALGDGDFAENTSSESRGPGFVISTFAQIGEQRISGVFSVLPAAPDEAALKVVLLPDNAVIPCNPALEDGVTRADLRPLAKALGYKVHPHIPDQGKVYLRKGN